MTQQGIHVQLEKIEGMGPLKSGQASIIFTSQR